MRCSWLLLLVACGSTTPRVVESTPAPEAPPVAVGEALEVFLRSECEALAEGDMEARFATWDPNAQVRFERLPDEPSTVVSLRGEKARERLMRADDLRRNDENEEAVHECLRVDDLDTRLVTARRWTWEAVVEQLTDTPDAIHSVLAEVSSAKVWVQLDSVETDEGRVRVRGRRVRFPLAQVEEVEGTVAHDGVAWRIVALRTRLLELLPPMRDAVVLDAAFYEHADARAQLAATSGDVGCEVRALLDAQRPREALERALAAHDPALEPEIVTAAGLVGRADVLATHDPDGELQRSVLMAAVIGSRLEVCGTRYDTLLGSPRRTGSPSAFRTCSSSDSLRIAQARASGTTLEEDDFCAPAPDELHRMIEALARDVAACVSADEEVPLSFELDASGTPTELQLYGSAAETCLRTAVSQHHVPAFRLRAPEPSFALMGNGGLAGLMAQLMQLMVRAQAMRNGTPLPAEPTEPAWHVSVVVHATNPPTVEPRVSPFGL
ncbi:MAG: hypothetical protein KC586_20450 [Myxococcales bacterium]|nr:hypothetical protein [Myxococcales bacterium]